jgi:hypothetical protein
MLNPSLNSQANRKDRFIGSLNYYEYLVTEPFNHLLSGAEGEAVYELSRTYFINSAVLKRLRKESRNKQGGLEREAA